MDDIFTQDNDDSYREIALSNGFQLKMNPKMIMDKPCNNINSKKLNEVIEDQLDDLNENEYTKNDYISLINTTYNINLFSLFQQNSMDDFFLLFNKNVKEIISYKEPNKYNFEIKFSTLL